MDDLGLVETVDRLGESIVITVADASDHARCAVARPRGCGRSDCRLLRAMVSPKTSRAVPRRPVLLASGLGIPPMTLDLDVICIWASPSQGSPLSSRINAAVRPRGFAGFDDELSPVALPDAA
jgi:hypothetical protein